MTLPSVEFVDDSLVIVDDALLVVTLSLLAVGELPMFVIGDTLGFVLWELVVVWLVLIATVLFVNNEALLFADVVFVGAEGVLVVDDSVKKIRKNKKINTLTLQHQ